MTLRQIANVFCLNTSFMVERMARDAVYRGAILAMKEYSTEAAYQELKSILANDQTHGTRHRFYYISAVRRNLQSANHSQFKEWKPSDQINQLIQGIFNSWSSKKGATK